ncbi:unnamed protein product, partial [Amoebophrya sp. A120]|eukprot:GSA120T00013994001.1
MTSGKTWQECVRGCAESSTCKHLVHVPAGNVAGAAKLTDGTTGYCHFKTVEQAVGDATRNTVTNSLD